MAELDVLSVSKSLYTHELEVKVSRADFRADAKKRKWWYYENRTASDLYVPNYFTYVCPEGMIKPEELKPYMGLIYYNAGQLTVIKKSTIIHRQKCDTEKLLTKIARVNNWKQYFGVQKLTIQNREAADKEAVRERMIEVNKHRNPKII